MTRQRALQMLAAVVGSIGAVLGQEWAWIQEVGGGKERFGLDLNRFESFEIRWGDQVERISAAELWEAIRGKSE